MRDEYQMQWKRCVCVRERYSHNGMSAYLAGTHVERVDEGKRNAKVN